MTSVHCRVVDPRVSGGEVNPRLIGGAGGGEGARKFQRCAGILLSHWQGRHWRERSARSRSERTHLQAVHIGVDDLVHDVQKEDGGCAGPAIGPRNVQHALVDRGSVGIALCQCERSVGLCGYPQRVRRLMILVL